MAAMPNVKTSSPSASRFQPAQATQAACFSKVAGLLLGTAVGDAVGLPREGLSPLRAMRLFGGAPLTQRLFFGRGMGSDDTEHTCLVAQSLLAAPEDERAFSRELAWRLRWWLAGVPAGVGWATLRSIVRLWVGYSHARSGVYSAGNGPAMRSALIGACFLSHDDRLDAYVRAATIVTHSDPRALDGALAVALAGQYAVQHSVAALDPLEVISRIEKRMLGSDFRDRLTCVASHLARKSSSEEVVNELGLQRGVSGYVLDTVPVALFCWLRWPGDFRMALEQAILLGGDTDTVAAIVGALSGATNGIEAIPPEWRNGLVEWPRSATWMQSLADRLVRQFHLSSENTVGPQPLFWPGLIPRNMIFAAAVILHALRRLLPPY
jgi:ADP-ribosyl-[dinitrogen reductase] hydrolase